MGASDESPPDIAVLFDRLFKSGRVNALIGWAMIGVLGLVLLESLLDVDVLWIVFVSVAGTIVVIPPVAYRDWRYMLPWELLLLGLFPVLLRGVLGGQAGTFSTYLAIAGLALIITAELHTFTALNVNHWFAVVLVVLATLATVATWTVLRWNMDRFMGTMHLSDNTTLMLEWVYVTLAGIAGGILFDGYFKQRDRVLWRVLRRRGR